MDRPNKRRHTEMLRAQGRRPPHQAAPQAADLRAGGGPIDPTARSVCDAYVSLWSSSTGSMLRFSEQRCRPPHQTAPRTAALTAHAQGLDGQKTSACVLL